VETSTVGVTWVVDGISEAEVVATGTLDSSWGAGGKTVVTGILVASGGVVRCVAAAGLCAASTPFLAGGAPTVTVTGGIATASWCEEGGGCSDELASEGFIASMNM